MPETMGQFVLLRDSGATPTLWSQFAQSFSCMLPGYRVSQPNVFVSPEKLVMEEEQLEGRCEPLRDLLVCSKQGILRMARKFPGLLDTCPHDLQLRLIILKVCALCGECGTAFVGAPVDFCAVPNLLLSFE
jgi:hypothetical protein